MADLKKKAADYGGKFGKLVDGFAMDQDAEQNGIWRTHEETGIRARIRRATINEYKTAVRKHFKPYAHLTTTPPREERLVRMKAAAETLVSGWEIGAEVPCTPDNVLEAFQTFPDFYDWVFEEANTAQSYRVAKVADDAGNSAGSSNGSERPEPTRTLPSSNEGQPEASRLPIS